MGDKMLTEPWLKPQPRAKKQCCCVHSLPKNVKQFEHKRPDALTPWEKKIYEHQGTVCMQQSFH